MVFEAAGVRGVVMVGHRVAYTLGRWSLMRKPAAIGDVSTGIVADVRRRDEFWATQWPMAVMIDMGSAWWRWPITQIDDAGRLTIRVMGDPEITGGP